MNADVPKGYEVLKIVRSVRVLARSFALQSEGLLPQVVHLYLLEAERDPQIEFLLMKNEHGFYYESTVPVNVEGKRSYLKVYLE